VVMARGVEPKDFSTLRLEQASADPEDRRVWAVRWLCRGAAAPYQLLDQERLLIGRGADSTARLESAGVSRSHAEIYRQGSIRAFRDLGSTNGSYVNGARVEHAALAEGDVVRIGDMVGVVLRVSATVERRESPAVSRSRAERSSALACWRPCSSSGGSHSPTCP
jgi:hypothetical protein